MQDGNFEKAGLPNTVPAMGVLAKLSAYPIIASMMMPFFGILNTAVVGALGDPNLLAGYGLGSLALAIVGVAPLVQFSAIQTVVG